MQLGQHEKAELHELLVFKSLMLTHTVMAKPMVRDSHLKGLVEESVRSAKSHIKDIQDLLRPAQEVHND